MAERPETLLLYASTDGGKTVQLGRIAEWEFNRTGRISRLISADSGWDPIKDLIISEANPNGIIDAWNVIDLSDPWVVYVELSEGSWPKVFQKADKSWGIRMVRPLVQDGKLMHSDGKRVIGQYLIEGLSTIGSCGVQDHVRHQRPMWGTGKESGTSYNSEIPFEVPGGSSAQVRQMTFGRAVGGHYGAVQNFLLDDLVPRFAGLRLVSRVVWTAHEARGKDDLTGMENAVLGPATVGKAAVDRTPQKFGHTFHLTVDTKFTADKKVQREFRAWFVQHPDEVLTKMNWPAKVSLSSVQSGALLGKFPGGFIPLNGAGIEQFLEFLHPNVAKTSDVK
jgi:hypothetical protein